MLTPLFTCRYIHLISGSQPEASFKGPLRQSARVAGKRQSCSLKPASRSGEKGTCDRTAGKLRERGTEVTEGKYTTGKRM